MARNVLDPAASPVSAPHRTVGVRYVRIASSLATVLREPERHSQPTCRPRLVTETPTRTDSALRWNAVTLCSSRGLGFARSLRRSSIAALVAGLTLAIAIARADLRESAGAKASTPAPPELALSRRLLELRQIASDSAAPHPDIPPHVRQESWDAPSPAPLRPAMAAEQAHPPVIPEEIEGIGDAGTTDPLEGLFVRSGLRWRDPQTAPFRLREIRSILGERHAMLADRAAPGEVIEATVGGRLPEGWNIAAIDDTGVTLLSPKGNPVYLKPSDGTASGEAGP